MAIGYVAKLNKGQHALDISSGRYSLMEFVPPAAGETISYGTGTSANRTGGGQIVNTIGINRDFGFVVGVTGTTQAEVDKGIYDLAAFLRMAGDEDEPLYLEYLPNNYIPYKPIWGQNGWRRVQVNYGLLTKLEPYGIASVRTKYQAVAVDVNIKPYIMGLKQKLAIAVGSVFEDYIGSIDGRAKGLRIPASVVNKFTNPVFMASTYSTDWTGIAGIDDYNREEYRLFGDKSVYAAAGSAGATCTQSLTLTEASYTIGFYAKRFDGQAVTAVDCKVHYGSAQTSTYTSVGNGWYWVSANVTGSTDATATGVNLVTDGAQIAIDGFMCALAPIAQPFFYADMIDGAWASTVHASTSTSTAAYLELDGYEDIYRFSGGTIRCVIKPDHSNSTQETFTLFDVNAIEAYYNAADDKFYLTDQTNTVSTAAQTWAAGDTIVLHFVYGVGTGLAIYKNGASAASGANYATNTPDATFRIGADAAGAEQMDGLWLDFTAWDRILTATEILNDYTNIAALVADGDRVGHIPWFGSPDNASGPRYTASTADGSIILAGGICGDVDAETGFAFEAVNDTYVNQYTGPYFSKYSAAGVNELYFSTNSTSGTLSVGTTSATYPNFLDINTNNKTYAGKKVYVRATFTDAGSNLYSRLTTYVGFSTGKIEGEWRPTSAGNRYIGPVKLPKQEKHITMFSLESGARPRVKVDYDIITNWKRSTGTANISVTKLILLPERLCFWDVGATFPSVNRIYTLGRRGIAVSTGDTDATIYKFMSCAGDTIELVPHKINHLAIFGATELSSIEIIPRWTIM